MAAGGLLVVVFVVIGIGGSLLLYWFVRAEAAEREVADRAEAERLARRDTVDEDE